MHSALNNKFLSEHHTLNQQYYWFYALTRWIFLLKNQANFFHHPTFDKLSRSCILPSWISETQLDDTTFLIDSMSALCTPPIKVLYIFTDVGLSTSVFDPTLRSNFHMYQQDTFIVMPCCDDNFLFPNNYFFGMATSRLPHLLFSWYWTTIWSTEI